MAASFIGESILSRLQQTADPAHPIYPRHPKTRKHRTVRREPMQPTSPNPPRPAGPRVRAPLPPITFPEELPVSARREDIAAPLRAHQVVIVCGETGSGKTTQLPKICLELGRGERGL